MSRATTSSAPRKTSPRSSWFTRTGAKLGIARLDLNDRIAEAIENADLDPDQQALLEKLLGKDYEVITADDRLDKLANDFVEHCTTRWESGKSLLVCIDKVTCAACSSVLSPAAVQAQRNQRPDTEEEAELSAEKNDDERGASPSTWSGCAARRNG